MARIILLILTSIAWQQCFSQSELDTLKGTKTLPIANNRATIKGFAFDTALYISKDSLNKGFTVILQDPSYKVIFFLLVHDCEDCDIWENIIFGNIVSIKNVPMLKFLRKGDLLSLMVFKIEKKGKYFTIPEVNILLTD